MALTDEGTNGFYMPVAPAYSGGNGGFGFGGDWAWILLLLLIGGNGWGFGGGWGGMMGMGMMDGFGLYPWLNNSQHISDGFRDQTLQTSVTGLGDKLTSGFGDLQTSLCSGFAGVNATVNNGVNSLSQQMNANQLSSLERSFAAQTAATANANALQAQLAQCCCDNRAGIADLRYTVATENCADRQVVSDGIRDLLTAQNANTQRILDQLCADKIDAKNDTISQLRQELLYARGQASQDVQTARLLAGQASEVDALYNRLATCPVGTMPVYGNQPIFTCGNNGCGVA